MKKENAVAMQKREEKKLTAKGLTSSSAKGLDSKLLMGFEARRFREI